VGEGRRRGRVGCRSSAEHICEHCGQVLPFEDQPWSVSPSLTVHTNPFQHNSSPAGRGAIQTTPMPTSAKMESNDAMNWPAGPGRRTDDASAGSCLRDHAMPPQHPRQSADESGEHRAGCLGQPWSAQLTAQRGDFVTQHKVICVLRLTAGSQGPGPANVLTGDHIEES
jgi:hypothetical protein